MVNYVCPCKDCVPPKRTPACHSTCKDYADWKSAREAEKTKAREVKKEHGDILVARFNLRRKR